MEPTPRRIAFRSEGLFVPGDRDRLWIGLAVAVVAPIAVTPVARIDALSTFPTAPYVLAVVVAALFGRLLAAAVATGVSVFMLDRFSETRSVDEVWATILFILVALVIADLFARLDRATRVGTSERSRLEFLSDVADALSGSLDVATTLKQLADVLVPTLADWFSVDLLEEGELRNILVVHRDPARVELAKDLQRRFPSDLDSPTGPPNVIRTGRSELTATITDEMIEALVPDPRVRQTVKALGLRCAMVLPLSARGRTFGTLTLIGAETHEHYDGQDLRLAGAIADRAALAIDTARLFAAETEARAAATEESHRNAVLKDATAAFGRATTVDDVVGTMLEQGIRVAGAAAGTVGLIADDRRVALVGTSGYAEQDESPYWSSFGLDDPLPLADSILQRRPVTISSTEERDRRFPALRGRGEQRDHALVCLPLLLGEEAIGGFSVSYPPGTEFDEDDLTFLRAIGEQCAQALERVRSLERERETRARFDALARVSRALARTLDYDENAKTIVRLAIEHLGRSARVFVRERGEVTALAVADPTGSRMATREDAPDPDLAAAIAATLDEQRPQLVPPEGDERPGVVLPLAIAGAPFGALAVADPARDYRVEGDLEFAREVARRMARALENARLYRERDRVAVTLQRSLLPPALPDVPGIDTHPVYLPALRGYEIGGDFYDVFETASGRWAAVIGDVCGKGVEAATLTGLARHTLRAVSEDIALPSKALEALNRALLRERLDGRFCTVAFLLIEPDPDGGARVLLSSGGHPLPQHVSRDGRTERVGAYGTLLGVGDTVHLEDVEVRLEPGESLIAFTDGILRRDEATGDEPAGLLELLERVGSPPDIGERIERYARERIGEEQEDDIAILVLRAR